MTERGIFKLKNNIHTPLTASRSSPLGEPDKKTSERERDRAAARRCHRKVTERVALQFEDKKQSLVGDGAHDVPRKKQQFYDK